MSKQLLEYLEPHTNLYRSLIAYDSELFSRELAQIIKRHEPVLFNKSKYTADVQDFLEEIEKRLFAAGDELRRAKPNLRDNRLQARLRCYRVLEEWGFDLMGMEQLWYKRHMSRAPPRIAIDTALVDDDIYMLNYLLKRANRQASVLWRAPLLESWARSLKLAVDYDAVRCIPLCFANNLFDDLAMPIEEFTKSTTLNPIRLIEHVCSAVLAHSPAHVAKTVKLLETLSALGFNMDVDSGTLLDIVGKRRASMLEVVLKSGANPNAVDDDGVCVLTHAFFYHQLVNKFNGSEKCVRLLVRHGAHPVDLSVCTLPTVFYSDVEDVWTTADDRQREMLVKKVREGADELNAIVEEELCEPMYVRMLSCIRRVLLITEKRHIYADFIVCAIARYLFELEWCSSVSDGRYSASLDELQTLDLIDWVRNAVDRKGRLRVFERRQFVKVAMKLMRSGDVRALKRKKKEREEERSSDVRENGRRRERRRENGREGKSGRRTRTGKRRDESRGESEEAGKGERKERLRHVDKKYGGLKVKKKKGVSGNVYTFYPPHGSKSE